jgi:hypothetical protein
MQVRVLPWEPAFAVDAQAAAIACTTPTRTASRPALVSWSKIAYEGDVDRLTVLRLTGNI